MSSTQNPDAHPEVAAQGHICWTALSLYGILTLPVNCYIPLACPIHYASGRRGKPLEHRAPICVLEGTMAFPQSHDTDLVYLKFDLAANDGAIRLRALQGKEIPAWESGMDLRSFFC